MLANTSFPHSDAFLPFSKERFLSGQGRETCKALLSALGSSSTSPQKLNTNKSHNKPLLHIAIAGSSGKSSLAFMLSYALSAIGLKTGTFLSPWIIDPDESFRIGEAIPRNDDINAAWEKVLPHTASLTPFEAYMMTAAILFREQRCDIGIWEAGLGGKTDAVAALNPQLVMLTKLGNDHRDILGPRFEDILRHKTGLFKNATRAFCLGNEHLESIQMAADQCNTQITFYDRPEKMVYEAQAYVAHLFDTQQKTAPWPPSPPLPGRSSPSPSFPGLILDTAHTIERLSYVKKRVPCPKGIILSYGRSRDAHAFLSELSRVFPTSMIFCTQHNIPKEHPIPPYPDHELAEILKSIPHPSTLFNGTQKDAITWLIEKQARMPTHKSSPFLALGSSYLVRDLYKT